jgi:hypothetical protein
MNGPQTDLLLKRMFAARAVVLVAGAVLLGSAALAFLADILPDSFAGIAQMLLPDWLAGMRQILAPALAFAALAAIFVIFAGAPFVWYYTFCVSLNEAGPKYAIGHLLLCIALTPVALTGTVFIPLLVYYDIERWEQSNDRLARPDAEQS